MDFDLKEEQRQLQASLSRLLADRYSFESRNRYVSEAAGWSEEMWSHYAAMGILGLPFSEEHGGFAGNAGDVMLVMEALGRVRALEPYLATVVLAGTALQLAGTPEQQAEMLPLVANGTLVLGWAHTEQAGWHDPSFVGATARQEGDAWILDGTKNLVLHGGSAHWLVTSARIAGDPRDRDGLGLFLVPGEAKGVFRRVYRLVDQTPAADLTLSGVRAQPLGNPGTARSIIERVIESGIAAVAAQAVGAMQEALDLTISYLKVRQQFGRPIGSNQALQHRAAEMLAATEQARSMAMLAAMMVDDAHAPDRRRHIAMAKVVVGREGRMVAQQALQLHGGIGMTEECAVGHYLRHLMVIDQLFGDTAFHLRFLVREFPEV
jgi:alkylation response protein AidB-like acyl-CoA dehydrogenase